MAAPRITAALNVVMGIITIAFGKCTDLGLRFFLPSIFFFLFHCHIIVHCRPAEVDEEEEQ